MNPGRMAYLIICVLSGWSVLSMVVCMVFDRRPVVGPNWRGVVWFPAYFTWRRQQLREKPWLLDLVQAAKPCIACVAASEMSAGTASAHDEAVLAELVALKCDCGRYWSPNPEALKRAGGGDG